MKLIVNNRLMIKRQIRGVFSLRTMLEKRFSTWLTKRMPSSVEQTLNQRNIFIFPTKFGFTFLAFATFLFVLGTNYQNNLIIILSYFLFSLMLTTMFVSFYNLLGLKVSCRGEYLTTAEQPINIAIKCQTKQDKKALFFAFNKMYLSENSQTENTKTIESLTNVKSINVPIYYYQRGVEELPSLTIQSFYPFGLFRTWSHLKFPIQVVVAPKPLVYLQNKGMTKLIENDKTANNYIEHIGSEVIGFEPFQSGQSLSKIAWKQFAKGQGLMTKHVAQTASAELNSLSLDDIDSGTLESKLQQLCFLVIEADKSGELYLLRLGDKNIGPNKGKEHLTNCLTLLAKF